MTVYNFDIAGLRKHESTLAHLAVNNPSDTSLLLFQRTDRTQG